MDASGLVEHDLNLLISLHALLQERHQRSMPTMHCFLLTLFWVAL